MKLLRLFALLLLIFTVSGGAMSVVIADDEAVDGVTRQKFVELFPSDLKPAFTQNTVVKLNAIVRRSLDAINEYDEIIKDVRVAVDKVVTENAVPDLKEQAGQKVAQITVLDQASKSALSDMMAAATELRNSDEVFNRAILAGMVDFVEDVEREIAAQQIKLTKILSEV